MPTAHIEGSVFHPGGDAQSTYWELYINGNFNNSGSGPVGYPFTVGCDVGEYTEVRLEAAAVGPDGQRTWASPSVINTGAAPLPDPNPNPNPTPPPQSGPTVSDFNIKYWY